MAESESFLVQLKGVSSEVQALCFVINTPNTFKDRQQTTKTNNQKILQGPSACHGRALRASAAECGARSAERAPCARVRARPRATALRARQRRYGRRSGAVLERRESPCRLGRHTQQSRNELLLQTLANRTIPALVKVHEPVRCRVLTLSRCHA